MERKPWLRKFSIEMEKMEIVRLGFQHMDSLKTWRILPKKSETKFKNARKQTNKCQRDWLAGFMLNI